jgi:hypothetical protein
MWNSTAASGSTACHEFVGFGGDDQNLGMRTLPCPCKHCCTPSANMSNYALCSNKDIVGNMTTVHLKQKIVEDSPLLLEEPLTDYTCAVLLQFIKSNMDKVPKMVSRKEAYINVIKAHLSDRIKPPAL